MSSEDHTIYRCSDYCNNCPFKDNGAAMELRDGRVDDIKKMLLRGGSFNCHKTVYNLDENMQETSPQDLKMCYGAYKYLKDNNKPNQVMQIAKRLGIEEI